MDKIGSLSIEENGRNQRRPGLHVQRPGVIDINKGDGTVQISRRWVMGWSGGQHALCRELELWRRDCYGIGYGVIV